LKFVRLLKDLTL